MKFTCTKENLAYSLQLVSAIAQKHTHLAILSNIFIQANDQKVELVATDLEIALKVQLRAKVDEPGSFTVPAKTLVDYVNLLPETQIDISLVDNELSIEAGRSRTKIKGSGAEEFPVIPDIEEVHSYLIDAKTLKESLSNVLVAIAKNDIRPELSGVYMGFFTERYEGLVLAATDSYRLTEKKVKVKQGTEMIKCIVPSKTAVEMSRLISLVKQEDGEKDVRLWVSPNQIAMRFDHFEMTSRLIEGRYPDYAQIIPTKFTTIATFKSDDMVKKIKAASLFTANGVNAVNVEVKAPEHVISISSTSSQTGEHTSELESEVEGSPNAIVLNHRYVLDGLQQIGSENAVFQLNSADAPCMLTPMGDDSYLYIVMPIRQ